MIEAHANRPKQPSVVALAGSQMFQISCALGNSTHNIRVSVNLLTIPHSTTTSHDLWPRPPVLRSLEQDLHGLVYHVHDQPVLVTGGNLVQVVPHGHIGGQLAVVVEEQPVESRVVF